MGCSPSKGKLFSKPDNGSTTENPLPEESPQDCVKDGSAEKEEVEESVPLHPDREDAPDRDPEIVVDSKDNAEDETAPDTITRVQETEETNGTQRIAKNKKKRLNRKLRKTRITKVDFPPHMIRAHQAAYAFLNPSISKFEGLLELLDQTAHTQLSLQPMMSALVLRFEEINQALEEMAEEGELMLKEHGDFMAFPTGMMGTTFTPVLKPNGDACNPDPPPDLLQQLLRHSTEKMKHVGGSFQAVGDTTLEEAVEFFTSLSQVLVGKMEAKHNAEQRIALVLAQVEAAATGKGHPDDVALHSEDSGIGGENDSLTGSDRQRRQRGSAGSGSSASGANVRAVLPSNATNEHEEEEEEDDDDDIDEEDDDMVARQRSNSSPPDPSQAFLNMHRMQIKGDRPQTATASDGVVQNVVRRNPLAGHETKMDVSEVRRHSIVGPDSNTRLTKTNPVLPSQRPHPPSVKRLINSFSNAPSNVRTTRKTSNSNPAEGAQIWTENREDPDEDNLPPPPPEVLMDNSFQITEKQGTAGNGKESQSKTQGLPHRLRSAVELLPNRASIKAKVNVSSARQDAAVGPQEEGQQQLCPGSSLYQQAHAIIHIRSAAAPMQPPQRSDSTDLHEGDKSFSLPVIAPPVSRVRLPPSGPPVHHRHPSPPVRPPSSTSRPGSPKSITRATDNPVEEIIPSVSFRDARSVFCQKETPAPHWSSCGASVLPKPWGEGSRGRTGSRAADSPRRTQSEHRPITIRTGRGRHDHSPAPAGH